MSELYHTYKAMGENPTRKQQRDSASERPRTAAKA